MSACPVQPDSLSPAAASAPAAAFSAPPPGGRGLGVGVGSSSLPFPAPDSSSPAHLPTYSPPPSLPAVNPTDRASLSRYLALREDLPALAAASGQDLLDLLLWLTRPDIDQYVQAFRDTRNNALRQLALSHLESILKTAEDPIEKRRAASVILRALCQRPSPSVPNGGGGPEPRPRRGSATGNAAPRDYPYAFGFPVFPPAPTPAADAATSDHSVSPSLRLSNSDPPPPHPTQDTGHQDSGLPFPSHIPQPASLPDASLSHEQTARRIAHALVNEKPPVALATLYAYCFEDATICGVHFPPVEHEFRPPRILKDFFREQGMTYKLQHLRTDKIDTEWVVHCGPYSARFRLRRCAESEPCCLVFLECFDNRRRDAG